MDPYGVCRRRGLAVVLENWAAIRAGVAGAELDVYYGFSSMSNATEKERLMALLQQDGVGEHA